MTSAAEATHEQIRRDARALERKARACCYIGATTGGAVPQGHVQVDLSTVGGHRYTVLIGPDGKIVHTTYEGL